jgi:hypothetical protein
MRWVQLSNESSSTGHKLAKSGAQLKGLQAFKRKIKNIARIAPREFGNALWDELDEVEKPESMKRTPVDTGDLKESHETYGPFIRKDRVWAEIRVGGGKVDYAIVVHENTEAFHRVGQAKFLESTLLEAAPFILRRVKERMDLEKIAKKS